MSTRDLPGVSFVEPGKYGGFQEQKEDSLRGEISLNSQQHEDQDRKNSSLHEDCCGINVDEKKSKELLSDYLESASIHGIAQTKGPEFYSWRRLDEMLLQCSWNLKRYDCKDLFRPLHTGYGTCYVFNGPEIETHNLAKAVSLFSQLRVMVSIGNRHSYYSKLMHAGIKVLVHQQDEMPFPLFEGYFVRPGVAASMALTRSDSKCLPFPYKAYNNGYCEDTKAEGYQNRLKRYAIYNGNNCLNDCMFEKLEEACGCRHYFANGNHTVCSAKQILTCYMPKYGKYALVDTS
ncbi:acid-sensing ion channel 2-like [Elysia marginata]|uniref:Acid-sensing ion channel 2-like n=1 Tax=Elysia marginata TaxID=1093978 RepID=A0AAV4GNA6_9GAST|nr:acid-sensing ion channel 2-like [Elysia marginata]